MASRSAFRMTLVSAKLWLTDKLSMLEPTLALVRSPPLVGARCFGDDAATGDSAAVGVGKVAEGLPDGLETTLAALLLLLIAAALAAGCSGGADAGATIGAIMPGGDGSLLSGEFGNDTVCLGVLPLASCGESES